MHTAKRFSVVAMALSVAVFALLGFSVVRAQAITAQLHRWKLLPEPERLTELYFANHASLPQEYLPGQAQTIGFVAHNLQGHAVNYSYTITEIGSDNQQRVLAGGHFSLPNGQYHHQTISITPADMGSAKVQVSLQPGGEFINYWTMRG